MRHSDLKHMRGGYKITLENIFKSVTITLDQTVQSSYGTLHVPSLIEISQYRSDLITVISS